MATRKPKKAATRTSKSRPSQTSKSPLPPPAAAPRIARVAKGKKQADKRETSAKRDWERQKARIMKNGLRS